MGKAVQKWDATGLSKLVKGELTAHLRAGGEKVLEIARGEIDAPKHGKIYYSKGLKKKYRASAPGEALASPTGKVRNNLEVEIGQTAGGGVAVRIGPNKSVAGIVRRLTFGNRKVKPRPTLEPALEGHRAEVEAALRMGK